MELSGTSGRIFDENAVLMAYGSCGGSIRKLNLIPLTLHTSKIKQQKHRPEQIYA